MASPPLRSGELDLCQYGKIIVQDVQLAAIHKEWDSGDFVAASPDVSAKAAIDGDAETAWIPERVLGFYDENTNFKAADKPEWGEVFVLEANMGIPPGLGKGYRWIQLASIQNPLKHVIICNKHREVGGLIELGGSCRHRRPHLHRRESESLFGAQSPGGSDAHQGGGVGLL